MQAAWKQRRGSSGRASGGRAGTVVLAGLMVALTAACARQAVVQSSPASTTQTVEVRLSEHQIDMPMAIPAGEITFRIRNAGSLSHGFEIEGNGIERRLGTELAPGETGTLRVQLGPGSYDVFCPVADHERRGMFRRLTVTRG